MLSVPFIFLLLRQKEINQILIIEKFQFLVLFFCICIISYLLIKLPQWLNHYKKDSLKVSAYECGFEAFQTTKIKFNLQFFMVAFLFLLFDLEIMILFPFSGFAGHLSASGQGIGIIFVLLLLIGFVYEWFSGLLHAISNNILVKKDLRQKFFFRFHKKALSIFIFFLPQLNEELLYASTDTAFFGIFLGGFTVALEGSSAFEIDFDYFLVDLIGFILLAKIFYLLIIRRIFLFLRTNLFIFQIALFISLFFTTFFYALTEFFISFNFNVSMLEDHFEEEFTTAVRNAVISTAVEEWDNARPLIKTCCCNFSHDSFDTSVSIETLEVSAVSSVLNLVDFVTICFCFVEFIGEELLGQFQRYDAGTASAAVMDTQYFY